MADDHPPVAGNTDDGFDIPDLGVLGDGVTPTHAEWQRITTEAGHRRSRRNRMLSATAALVLIAISATVVLTRSSDENSVDQATGGVAGSAYVIPPEDATDVAYLPRSSGYSFQYSIDGRDTSLSVLSDQDLAESPGLTVQGLLGAVEAAGIPRIATAPFGNVFLACSGEFWAATSGLTGATATLETVSAIDDGPLMAVWTIGDQLVTFNRANDKPCTPSEQSRSSVSAAIGRLRLVDAAGFRAYVDENTTTPTTDSLEEGAGGPRATEAPIAPENPPADPVDARAQIELAVQRYADPYPDGTFPYLEDGVIKAEEYRQRFATATRQAGSSSELGSANVQTLNSVVFTSPEAAQIQFSITASLPSGRYTFGQSGTAVLQDGRWVLSYDTLLSMLGRACAPPGGNDPSCQNGG